jgi:hypothetical protein
MYQIQVSKPSFFRKDFHQFELAVGVQHSVCYFFLESFEAVLNHLVDFVNINTLHLLNMCKVWIDLHQLNKAQQLFISISGVF